jgi:hypothetical protein
MDTPNDEYGFQAIVVFDGDGRFVTAVLRPAKRVSEPQCCWCSPECHSAWNKSTPVRRQNRERIVRLTKRMVGSAPDADRGSNAAPIHNRARLERSMPFLGDRSKPKLRLTMSAFEAALKAQGAPLVSARRPTS